MIKITAVNSPGQFEGTTDAGVFLERNTPYKFGARFDLFLIRNAWNNGCNFEKEADGFGVGFGTQGDWSAIRDSSDVATMMMLEKAINFLGLEV